jgi:hypothetical protein
VMHEWWRKKRLQYMSAVALTLAGYLTQEVWKKCGS